MVYNENSRCIIITIAHKKWKEYNLEKNRITEQPGNVFLGWFFVNYPIWHETYLRALYWGLNLFLQVFEEWYWINFYKFIKPYRKWYIRHHQSLTQIDSARSGRCIVSATHTHPILFLSMLEYLKVRAIGSSDESSNITRE